MLRILIATLCLAGAAPAFAQVQTASMPLRPALKAEVSVSSALVRIGDLIENAGPVADVAIFRAPDLGQTGTVQVARVIDAIRPHRLIDIDTGGIGEVSVTRASRMITVKQIEESVTAAFAGQYGFGDASDLSVSFDRDARALHVEPSASGQLRMVALGFDRGSSRFDISFELSGSASAQRQKLRFTGTIAETMETAVLTRPIARGEVIRASDVLIERRPKNHVNGSVLQSPEHVIGRAGRRALRSGEPIRSADLMKPEIVRQNETVTLLYRVTGIVLTVRGKALESGAEGDLVNVLNTQSKRTVQGTVTGPNQVTVVSTTARVVTPTTAALSQSPQQATE